MEYMYFLGFYRLCYYALSLALVVQSFLARAGFI